VSIRTAILALTPAVYWPLNDTNSSTAADASGNGRTGIFLGPVALGAPGPETGTTCLASSAYPGGVNIQGNNTFPVTPPVTMMCWFGATALATSGNVLLYDGSSAATGTGLTMHGTTLWTLTGGVGTGTTGKVVSEGQWHQFAFGYSPGVHYEVWVDGVSVQGGAIGTYNAVLVGNALDGVTPDAGLLAHVAFWGSLLTTAQVLGVWNAGPGLVPVPPVTGRAATDADILALETKLDTIVASVRRSY